MRTKNEKHMSKKQYFMPSETSKTPRLDRWIMVGVVISTAVVILWIVAAFFQTPEGRVAGEVIASAGKHVVGAAAGIVVSFRDSLRSLTPIGTLTIVVILGFYFTIRAIKNNK
jgi:uncharacterized protein (TIGR04206 family)